MVREAAKTFQDLIVWQKAHKFVLATYAHTGKFPQEEIYGLTRQFRRAAVSVAANIAEGFKKRGKKDKVKFLNTAQGSLEECRYYILLSFELGYGDSSELNEKLQEVSRLLSAYTDSIRNSIS